jgi:hypothetical protein
VRRRRLALVLALAGALLATAAAAQGAETDPFGTGLDEEQAFAEARNGRHIRARELAESLLERDPESHVGHFVLALVHHYGEANHARALFHANRALGLFEGRFGDQPQAPAPWIWHARLLREIAFIHSDLEHYEEQLAYMARYSELYEPDFIAERAWPLMKLRRFDDARQAADLGRQSGDPRQEEIALNALCAIEFEAGDATASYAACEAAMNLEGADPARQEAVDFTNYAEAARSMFRLDEAERALRLATEARVSWYGNPWVEMAELYLRQGRIPAALSALEEVPRYRARRPPHVQNGDRNEGRRALASFFLVAGRAEDALRVTGEGLAAPDRRAHQSRDPAQDRALLALLDRAGHRLRAERRVEDALGEGWWPWLRARVAALSDRWAAWTSGRQSARQLADASRLVGTFQVGTHRSAVMPPWLVGDLVGALGAGVVLRSVAEARAEDDRPAADAYYDAFEADATLDGDARRARQLAESALAGLPRGEELLRARLLALVAEASRRLDEQGRATSAYDAAFQGDPGVFRRYGWRVPVRFAYTGSLGGRVAGLLRSSPRLTPSSWGLQVRAEVEADRGEVCLLNAEGSVLGCGEATPEGDEGVDAFLARVCDAFHEVVFAPRVNLSQTDANGLDGSNQVSRDALRTLFDHQPPPRE